MGITSAFRLIDVILSHAGDATDMPRRGEKDFFDFPIGTACCPGTGSRAITSPERYTPDAILGHHWDVRTGQTHYDVVESQATPRRAPDDVFLNVLKRAINGRATHTRATVRMSRNTAQ